MVLKTYNKKNYKTVELWDGIDCNTGNTNYTVYTKKNDFIWMESFQSKPEAENWINNIA